MFLFLSFSTVARFKRNSLRPGKFRDQMFDEQQQDERNFKLSGRRRLLRVAAPRRQARENVSTDQK